MVSRHQVRVAAGEVVPELLAVRVGRRRRGTSSPVEEFVPAGHEPGVAVVGAVRHGDGEAFVQRELHERGLQSWAVEVGRRVALLGGHDPVGGGDEVVAGHRLQRLTEVHDHGAVVHGHVDPLAVLVLHLEPADAALQQQGEEAGVVVRVDTGFASGCGRIVDELDERHAVGAEELVEVC